MRRHTRPLIWLACGGLVTGLHATVLHMGWTALHANPPGTGAHPSATFETPSAPVLVLAGWTASQASPAVAPPTVTHAAPAPLLQANLRTSGDTPSRLPGNHGVRIDTPDLDTSDDHVTPSAGAPTDPIYLPRSALTQAPQPLVPIEVPYPDTAPLGHWQVRLSLFIDDQGQVRQVRVDDAHPAGRAGRSASPPDTSLPVDSAAGLLPPALADSARQAFLQARFAPGEREGRPVASLLRIEVEFQAQPLPDTAAAAFVPKAEPDHKKSGPALADPPSDRRTSLSST